MTAAPEAPVDRRQLAGCPRQRARSTTRSTSSISDTPALADGVQLLGEYAGSGYREPQYLARRPDGQQVQLSRLLHEIAEECDGDSDLTRIAERVTESYGKSVSADNVAQLVEEQLRPLGVLAAADGSSPDVEPTDPLFGLKLRTQVLSPQIVQRIGRFARPLFSTPVVAVVIGGLLAVDCWLFLIHGVGGGLRSSVQQPWVFLLVIAVVVVSTALHELGHAAACSYGGAEPGGMGVGIYIIWPAFYTDVTNAYQLDRKGRLRTDLGGVFVNAIVVIAVAATYFATRFEPLVLICFLLQIQVLQQMLPFIRLDGYYVLSDLVGVPDLFRRIGPVLRSSVPFRPREESVEKLKPWVRRVIAGWVFVLIPVLGLNFAYFVLAAPRIVATAWDSAAGFIGTMTSAGGATAVFAGVQLVLLVLPTVGITYTMSRFVLRGGRAAWRWSASSGVRRGLVLAVGAAAAAGLVLLWLPDVRMSPYRDGETGTVTQHYRELAVRGTGSPLLRSPAAARDRLPAVAAGDSAVLDLAPVTDPPTPAPEPGAAADPSASVPPTPGASSVPSTAPADPGSTTAPNPRPTPAPTSTATATPLSTAPATTGARPPGTQRPTSQPAATQPPATSAAAATATSTATSTATTTATSTAATTSLPATTGAAPPATTDAADPAGATANDPSQTG